MIINSRQFLFILQYEYEIPRIRCLHSFVICKYLKSMAVKTRKYFELEFSSRLRREEKFGPELHRQSELSVCFP